MGSRVLLWKEPKKTNHRRKEKGTRNRVVFFFFFFTILPQTWSSRCMSEKRFSDIDWKVNICSKFEFDELEWFWPSRVWVLTPYHHARFSLLHRKPLISYRTFECGIEVVTSERGTREDDVSKETREIRANMFVEFCSGRNFRTRSSYLSLSRVIPSTHFSWNLSRCVAVIHSLR